MNSLTSINSDEPLAKGWWLTALFALVLLISIIVHLPAAWVMNMASIKTALQQQGLQINSADGSIWSGSANLGFITANNQSNSINSILPAGRVSWELSVWSMLALQTKLNIDWQYQTSNIQTSIRSSVLSMNEINVEALQGQLDVAETYVLFEPLIAPHLSSSALANFRLLKTAQGRLDIDKGLLNLTAIADSQQTKFIDSILAQVNLKATLNDLQLMGNRLPRIDINVVQQPLSKMAELKLVSQAESWNMLGEFSAESWQTFSGELNVKAMDSSALPGWAFTMQKKTDTHYFALF